VETKRWWRPVRRQGCHWEASISVQFNFALIPLPRCISDCLYPLGRFSVSIWSTFSRSSSASQPSWMGCVHKRIHFEQTFSTYSSFVNRNLHRIAKKRQEQKILVVRRGGKTEKKNVILNNQSWHRLYSSSTSCETVNIQNLNKKLENKTSIRIFFFFLEICKLENKSFKFC